MTDEGANEKDTDNDLDQEKEDNGPPKIEQFQEQVFLTYIKIFSY